MIIFEEMTRWFVVNTKPRSEERAARNLSGGGIEVLAPKLRLRRFRRGKAAWILEPMFPNYIFARFDPVSEYHLIKYTRGVKALVNFNGKIIPLPEEIVAFIREKLVDGVGTIEEPGFKKGEKVLIRNGPFKGLKGIFEKELAGEERVAVLLDGVNYYAKMEINRDLLERTDDTEDVEA
jgi:transcriptional antiterminator RfaH